MNPYRSNETLFLEIGPIVRMGLLFYLFAYRVFFPVIVALADGRSHDLLAARLLAEFYYTCLLAFPFIFYRREYGWLHPLVLPTIYSLGKGLLKDPLQFLLPLDFPMVNLIVETSSPAAVLSISQYDLALARLGEALVRCLAMTTMIAAFLFGPHFPIPKLKIYRPNQIVVASMLMIGMLLAAAIFFVLSQGGFSALIIAMRGGRVALFSGQGQFLFAATAAPTIALVWYMYERKPFLSPWFIGGFAASCLVALLVSGSRSALLMPVLTLVLLWWKRSSRPLILPTAVAGLIGLLVLGAFGAIRQDFGSSTIDLSVFNPSRFGEVVSRALDETERRTSQESDLAVFQGAHTKGFLWGRTYIGAAAFMVPRAIWPDKPRSADAYNMWVNYANQRIDSEFPERGFWGIPVGAEMEAYWNFNLPGVILVFFLLGMFYKTLVEAAKIYRHVPFFWASYLFIMINFAGTSKSLVDTIRNILLLIMFAYMAGIFRFGSGVEKPLDLRILRRNSG